MIAVLTALLVGPMATAAPEHPCEEIKAACEKAGFVKGEFKEGKGLWKDCIEPIVLGTPPPKNTKLSLPTIDPSVVTACKAMHGTAGEGMGAKKK